MGMTAYDERPQWGEQEFILYRKGALCSVTRRSMDRNLTQNSLAAYTSTD
jgi:hypothetical protein